MSSRKSSAFSSPERHRASCFTEAAALARRVRSFCSVLPGLPSSHRSPRRTALALKVLHDERVTTHFGANVGFISVNSFPTMFGPSCHTSSTSSWPGCSSTLTAVVSRCCRPFVFTSSPRRRSRWPRGSETGRASRAFSLTWPVDAPTTRPPRERPFGHGPLRRRPTLRASSRTLCPTQCATPRRPSRQPFP